jgi:ketosteroid isomerase-like protein
LPPARDTHRAMPEESTTPDVADITRKVFAAATDEDLDATTAYLAPDAVWEMYEVGLGPFEGVAAIRAFLKEWWSTWEEHHHDVEEVLDLGHGVVYAVVREDGQVKGSDGVVRVRVAHVSLWVEGLVVRDTTYTDTEAARKAAERLSEERGSVVSRATVEFVNRFYDALNKHNEAALLELVHPDVEFRSLIQEVEGSFRGHQGVRDYLSGLFTTFPDCRIDVHGIREVGGNAVVKVRARATGFAGGTSIDLTDWQAVRVRDGKAIWWAFFRTETEARAGAERVAESSG